MVDTLGAIDSAVSPLKIITITTVTVGAITELYVLEAVHISTCMPLSKVALYRVLAKFGQEYWQLTELCPQNVNQSATKEIYCVDAL